MALTLVGCATTGQQSSAPAIIIARPIMVATQAAGGSVAAYAVFTNTGAATSIVEAQTECAGKVELHLVRRDGPNAGMTTDWPLALPSGTSTAIEPPGIPRHIMLADMNRAVAIGESCPIRFRLADDRWIEAEFAAVESSTEAWAAFGAGD